MRVVYKKTILEKIAEEKTVALVKRKEIDHIVLNQDEWDEFVESYDKKFWFPPSMIGAGLLKDKAEYDGITLVKGGG